MQKQEAAESKVHIEPFDRAAAHDLAVFAVQATVDTYGYDLPRSARQAAETSWAAGYEQAQPDTILLAKLGARIVGYTEFGESDNTMPARSKELRKLYVARELYGQGVGQQLMDAALQTPMLSSAQLVYLWVWGGNHRAIRFYQKYNFIPFTARHYTSSDGEPTFDQMMVRKT